MATLQLTFNGGLVQEFYLDKDTYSIGRKSDNDIVIDNLAVSGHHAKVLTILNDSFIEDLNSTNGTYVNGTLIQKQPLQNNDLIKIGKHEIKYINDAATSGDQFEKTMIIMPDAAGMPESEGDAKLEQSVSKIASEIASSDANKNKAKLKAKVKLLNGVNTGKELMLTKVLTTLGKPGLQVAAITRRPTGYFLIHVDGGDNAGRPKVDDAEIGVSAHPLHNGCVIEVAGVKMEFILE